MAAIAPDADISTREADMTIPAPTSRRALLLGAAATGLFVPGVPRAQPAPIRLGCLAPMTGSGGPFGPEIRAGQEAVIKEVNAAGGVLGRPVELMVQDDETNPDAGVRGARKLIDVDKVIVIMGTWASAVATAVAPLCWENKVMFICIGAADSVTQLPHQGYIVRTQPSTRMQAEQFGAFAIAERAKRLHILMPQTPFTASTIQQITDFCAPHGVTVTSTVYDASKNSFRSEVDAAMRANPDMLMMGGYQNDDIVVAKDLYRAGYTGRVVAYAFGVTPGFVEAVGRDLAEGICSIEPISDVGSTAYNRLQKLLGRETLNIYTCQGYDEANLAILSIAAAKEASGVAIHDNVRRIGDANGVKVDNAQDGLKALAAGKAINYLGASSSCKFAANGDVLETHFKINVVRGGKIETLRIT
jgi:branched-chain amino acid transport system substrate-binding protein